MQSRWYNVTLLIFWLTTMSWLMIQKMLPALRQGNPPTYQISLVQGEPAKPQGWKLFLDDQPLGWAVSQVEMVDGETIRLTNYTQFSHLVLDDLLPSWFRQFGIVDGHIGAIELDIHSQFDLELSGRPREFLSVVRLAQTEELIHVHGYSVGKKLHVRVGSVAGIFEHEIFLTPDSQWTDIFSPPGMMQDLQLHKSWSVPVFNPFAVTDRPLDLLIARVEREDYVFWQGQLQKAFVVVYRSGSNARSVVGRREKGQLWIDKRGKVLRQQVDLFGSTLKFERMSDTLSQEHWSKAIREIGEVAETSLTLDHDKAFSTKHVTGTND